MFVEFVSMAVLLWWLWAAGWGASAMILGIAWVVMRSLYRAAERVDAKTKRELQALRDERERTLQGMRMRQARDREARAREAKFKRLFGTQGQRPRL